MDVKRKKHKKAMRRTLAAIPPPLTFDTLTIDFAAKTVTFRGRTFTVETNAVSIPVTNDVNLLTRAGWFPLFPTTPESVA